MLFSVDSHPFPYIATLHTLTHLTVFTSPDVIIQSWTGVTLNRCEESLNQCRSALLSALRMGDADVLSRDLLALHHVCFLYYSSVLLLC